MKFGPVPLDNAPGKILGHNIAGPDGKRAFRKGRPLTAEDVAALKAMGRTAVYVAELESGDVDEDAAARRVAQIVMGQNLRPSGPASGRVNLLAVSLAPSGVGVVRVDVEKLSRLNEEEAVTVATLVSHSPVRARQIAATIKIIPFAVPEATLRTIDSIGGPVVQVDPLLSKVVGIILSGSPAARERVTEDFDTPLKSRIASLGSEVRFEDYVPLEDERGEAELAETLRRQKSDGAQLIVLAGETAIMDRYDIAPRAIERAGGEVTCFGAPVDPGNLLLVGYIGDTPVLGAPGCARSRKANVVDWVLPRLLVGDPLTRKDVMAFGHGGLLEEILERPMLRDEGNR
ncbi:MAG TPA: molybdopterin-binding protein [Anaerolineales bacterium]|nr:molybdopterin-binding protein [Anaerolineales bacterium]